MLALRPTLSPSRSPSLASPSLLSTDPSFTFSLVSDTDDAKMAACGVCKQLQIQIDRPL